ncbi:MAG: PEP-CTERM sorting domain-containing protein [Candidatus Brocadiia bacterium]
MHRSPSRRIALLAVLLALPAAACAGLLMEAETVTLPATVDGQTDFHSVSFQGPFGVTPLVFALPTSEGADPCDLRVRNVTATGFEIAQVEPAGGDGTHGAMTIDYVAVEPGRGVLSDGTAFEAASISTTTNRRKFAGGGGFDTISFTTYFDSPPALLGQIQTLANESGAPPGDPSIPFLSTTIQDLSSDTAQIALERAEADDGGTIAVPETIGYLAIAQAASSFVDDSAATVLFDSFISPDDIQGWDDTGGSGNTIAFNQTFPSPPLVIGNQATRDGGDGGWLRRGAVSASSVNLIVDEDQVGDGERGHTDERASVFAASQPFRVTADEAAPPLITHATRTGGSDPQEPLVMPFRLREDALAFADRPHEWNDLPPAHPELVGADYVRIANDDRGASNFRLNVGLSDPATVYIFWDNRVSRRPWLAKYGFLDTGTDIGVDEGGNGSIDRYSSVLWGNFPAGAVDLFEQNQGGTNMYGVAGVRGQLAPDAHVYRSLTGGRTFVEDPAEPGRLVMEGEHFSARQSVMVGGTEQSWYVMPDEDFPGSGSLPFSNARGGQFIEALPDGLAGGSPNEAPYADYRVRIETPGEYQLYVRWDSLGGGLDGTSDSFYAGILELADGGGGAADWYRYNKGGDRNFATDPWDDNGAPESTSGGGGDQPARWTFDYPGIYTIRISMREDGAGVDALILQLAGAAAPGGTGPAESGSFSVTPVLAAFSKLGGDPDAVEPHGIAGGFFEGVAAYADAPGAWTGIPGPLVGSDYMLTENDDAGFSFVDYSLLPEDDSFLYILLDDRYIAGHDVPQWMADMGFFDTRFDVFQEPGLPFSIFQGEAAGGEAISLYALDDPNSSFYGIVLSDRMLIPEPGSLALLGLGALGLLRRRRRRA